MTSKMGFIGLGVMGSGMCKRILGSGNYALSVHDVDAAKSAEMVGLGATAASLADLARDNSVIAASLPNPNIVRNVFTGPGGVIEHAKPGTVIIDLSTVDSETSKEVSAALAAKGITYIDAPVSGGKFDTVKGSLTIILGAKEEEVTEIRPLIDLLGTSIHFAGSRGAGSTIKLVNNVISMGITLLTGEAFVLGAKAGIDGGTLFNILQHCGGRSLRMQKRFPSILEGDFSPRFTVDLAEKDLALAMDLAHKLKVPMLMASLCHDFFLMTSRTGRGGLDATAVVQHLEQLAGTEVRGKAVVSDKYN